MNQRPQPRRGDPPAVHPHLPETLQQWDTETMLETAETLAQHLKPKMDTQLRRIFDSVKRLEMDLLHQEQFSRDQLLMLKPRLAYTVSRTPDLKPLYRVISQALHRIHDRQDFNKLVAFLEAVLAYYKFHHTR